ncbi:MAG: type IV pili methyl-accepting chemotaxis transducer N-terminal domain-containing protein [Bacillota bacterium]
MSALSGMSIRWKLLIPVILISVITVFEIYLVVNMNRLQQEDTVSVNVAGRQRMLSQKMTKETLNYMATKDQSYAKAQADTIAAFEKSLEALLQGGQLDISGRTVNVKPTDNEQVLAALNDARQYWQKVKPEYLSAVQHLADSHKLEVSDLNNSSMELLKRFDAITGMYETASAATVKRNMTLIYTGLVIYLLAALGAWFYVQRTFIRPVLALRDAARRIATGDLSEN